MVVYGTNLHVSEVILPLVLGTKDLHKVRTQSLAAPADEASFLPSRRKQWLSALAYVQLKLFTPEPNHE